MDPGQQGEDDSDHVDPNDDAGQLSGPAGDQRRLPAGLEAGPGRDADGVRPQQQQDLRLLRPAHVVRLERGRPEHDGDEQYRHDVHHLESRDGPGHRPGRRRHGPREDPADRPRQGGVRPRLQPGRRWQEHVRQRGGRREPADVRPAAPGTLDHHLRDPDQPASTAPGLEPPGDDDDNNDDDNDDEDDDDDDGDCDDDDDDGDCDDDDDNDNDGSTRTRTTWPRWPRGPPRC